MEIILRYLINALAIVVTFSVVVFVHELGHLITALRAGVEVKAFSLGFGRELFGFTRNGIRYKISAIPLGGYVKMKGEDPSEEDARSEGALMGLSPFKRIGVLASGAFMNFLTGAVIFSAIILLTGMAVPDEKPIIGEVLENSPAAEAGIREGDLVIAVDGEKIERWEDIPRVIGETGEEPVEITLKRDQVEEKITVTPEIDPASGRPMIGITQQYEMVMAGPVRSVAAGFTQTGVMSWMVLRHVYLMITRQLEADVAGPIGIGMHISQAAHAGLEQLFWLIAFISINLGLINLFPIPVLDGGHIIIALVEKVKGAPLKIKTIQAANLIGLAILIALMVYVFYADILRLFTGRGV